MTSDFKVSDQFSIHVNNKEFLRELNDFFGRASLQTYAGEGQRVTPQRHNFIELEYIDRDWRYVSIWQGDLTSFHGSGKIHYNEDVVFSHDFMGGLILP